MPSELERRMQRGEKDSIALDFSYLQRFIKYSSETPKEYIYLLKFVEQVKQYILEEVK